MEQTRERLLFEIDQYIDSISENEKRIDTIKKQLEDTNLKESEVDELKSELETLEEENDDNRKDVAMLEEVLHRMDMEEVVDERSCSPYEERYDPLDEVFTGGDY